MWGSQTSQARTPDRRYRKIRACLSGEVGTSAEQAPDVRYLEKVGCRPDRMVAVRHPDKGRTLVGQNSGYEISGWNEGFPSGWNERCHVSQGAVCVSKEEGATRYLFREDPTVGGCASSSGRFWAVA